MRFSYVMLPDYPLSDSIDMIKTADELGFHAVYAVDETWHKDWADVVRGGGRQDGARCASARTSRTCSCASRR